MRLYCLRLLVALLAFGVGVAAASLFDFKRTVRVEQGSFTYAPVAVDVPAAPEPPPPSASSCSWRLAHPTVSGGVLNGKAISKPQPAYPPIAKAARASGTVAVQVVVDEDGEVVSANAVSGHPLLQQAAVEAARQARFSPTRLSGQPVKVSGFITYNFVLE